MNPTAGIVWALVSAATWGTADFVGGFATRRGHAFQVLAIAATSGVVMLIALAAAFNEPMPSPADVMWAASAGLCGALGIASLYRGLAVGSAAIVAPTAGVITAAIPVLFNAATAGWPGAPQVVGFVVAAIGIWLVAQGSGQAQSRTAGLVAAILAGIGFGLFLVFIAQVNQALVFAPLAIGRTATMLVAGALLAAARVPLPPRQVYPLALLAGVLDAGGNVFYLIARQDVRLDIAAVLSSFYPVATVALSRLVLHERVSPRQWAGAVACLVAVWLITR